MKLDQPVLPVALRPRPAFLKKKGIASTPKKNRRKLSLWERFFTQEFVHHLLVIGRTTLMAVVIFQAAVWLSDFAHNAEALHPEVAHGCHMVANFLFIVDGVTIVAGACQHLQITLFKQFLRMGVSYYSVKRQLKRAEFGGEVDYNITGEEEKILPFKPEEESPRKSKRA